MEQVQTTPVASLSPVANSERIHALDLLRGFAIIGILLMNIEWFNRPITELLSFDMSQTGSDWASSWLVMVFVQGKFYKLFSLLFGMGFAVMLLRAQELNRPFGWWFTRRMVALYLIGIAHMVFLWGGDILHDYAVSGMLLLGIVGLLRIKKLSKFNRPDVFAKIGFTLILLPLTSSLIFGTIFGSIKDGDEVKADWKFSFEITQRTNQLIEETKASGDFVLIDDEYQTLLDEFYNERMARDNKISGDVEALALKNLKREQMREYRIEQDRRNLLNEDYWEVTQYRWGYTSGRLIDPDFSIGILLPVFLIGYWLVASGRMRRPEENKSFFTVMMWGGLGFGLIMSLAGALIKYHPAAEGVMTLQGAAGNLFFFGQFVLCAGYVGLFVKLSSKNWFGKIFGWLAPLGKMALTNYITHSIVLSIIFFGYGGAMLGQVSRTEQMGLVVAIIAIQAVVCTLWLKAFNYGPLEWLWRCMTYMKLQPMLKQK